MLGREELATLAGRVDLALGDSAYNRQELDALGFRPTGVFPIAVDTTRITRPVERPALDRILDDGLVNFLFVGRIAPNKKIEDLIKLAEVYKRYVDAYYRFIFVGRLDVVPRYYSMIRALMAEYRFLDDRFVFTGPQHFVVRCRLDHLLVDIHPDLAPLVDEPDAQRLVGHGDAAVLEGKGEPLCAGLFEQTYALQSLVGVATFWRQHLDGGDELTARNHPTPASSRSWLLTMTHCLPEGVGGP